MLIISTSSRLGVGKDEEEEEKEMKKEGSIRGCGGKGEESWKATNNYHQSSSSQHFHMLRLPVIGSSQRCVCVCVCVSTVPGPPQTFLAVFTSPYTDAQTTTVKKSLSSAGSWQVC